MPDALPSIPDTVGGEQFVAGFGPLDFRFWDEALIARQALQFDRHVGIMTRSGHSQRTRCSPSPASRARCYSAPDPQAETALP